MTLTHYKIYGFWWAEERSSSTQTCSTNNNPAFNTFRRLMKPTSVASLEFSPRLDNFAQIDYGDIELSQGVQDEADLIMSSVVMV